MRILTTLQGLNDLASPFALAAGVFDGVHRGHREVLGRARKQAAGHGAETWVLTFDPHPLRILNPRAAPALLTSTPHKLDLLAQSGIDGCIVLPFTRELADLEPEPFIDQLLVAAPSLREIVVGENWTFGHQARGDTSLLRKLASERSLAVSIVPGIAWNGEVISSTRIRQSVALGMLEEAEAMLGRPFSILGTVVHGKKLGRKLGFPTANLDPHNEVRPPPGIYAARAHVDGRPMPSAVYVGPAGSDVVEAHLIGQDLDLYGRDIEVCFHRKIRDDHRFDSQEDLRNQIARDVEHARGLLESAH
jgi:riboflavin kinase/FMN adenylyltransferase